MPKFVSPVIKRLRSDVRLNGNVSGSEEIANASSHDSHDVETAISPAPMFDDVFNKFKDLEYFVELVEVEQTTLASTDKEFRLEGWKRIHDKGIEYSYDWTNQVCDVLEQMWEACVKQTKELNLAALSATSSGMRSGMKRETYDGIYQFLKNGEYPADIANDGVKRSHFRRKCAEYAINAEDQIEYLYKGKRKIVLLEGEVELLIRYVHSALGHAEYQIVGNSISKQFHTSCSVKQIAKALIGGCTTDCKRIASQLNLKSFNIRLQRDRSYHVALSVNNEKLTPSALECVFQSSENVARVGMPKSNYQRICSSLASDDNDRKTIGYKFDQQKGLLTTSGKIVLDDAIGADVVFQLHNIYGHVRKNGLKDLLSLHFVCPGIGNFSGAIRSFCTFCALRAGNRNDATPYEIHSNADYDVLVDWKDGERKISIVPIGIDHVLVDSYIHRILKKYSVTEERITAKRVSLNVNLELMPIHRKILNISCQIMKADIRSSINSAVPNKSALKRKKKDGGLREDNRSVHWSPIYETMSSCGRNSSKIFLSSTDTPEETTAASPCEDSLDCFSDDDTAIVPNISSTKDFERSLAEFDVPQSQQYVEPLLNRSMAPSLFHEIAGSDEVFNMDDLSTDANIEGHPGATVSQNSFIELQPVIGRPQYETSLTFTPLIEDYYHMPNVHHYTPMPDAVTFGSTDWSQTSLGQVLSAAMNVAWNSPY